MMVAVVMMMMINDNDGGGGGNDDGDDDRDGGGGVGVKEGTGRVYEAPCVFGMKELMSRTCQVGHRGHRGRGRGRGSKI